MKKGTRSASASFLHLNVTEHAISDLLIVEAEEPQVLERDIKLNVSAHYPLGDSPISGGGARPSPSTRPPASTPPPPSSDGRPHTTLMAEPIPGRERPTSPHPPSSGFWQIVPPRMVAPKTPRQVYRPQLRVVLYCGHFHWGPQQGRGYEGTLPAYGPPIRLGLSSHL